MSAKKISFMVTTGSVSQFPHPSPLCLPAYHNPPGIAVTQSVGRAAHHRRPHVSGESP